MLEQIETFIRMQEALASTVLRVPSPDHLSAVFSDLMHAEGWQRIGLDLHLPDPYRSILEIGLSSKLTPATRHEEINRVDVGITFTPWGIAETGTVVEVALHERTRLLSTLPAVHVALLPVEGLVATPDALTVHLQRLAQEHPQAVVTFISGPSRTADIEMQLILGVHGPRQTFTLLSG